MLLVSPPRRLVPSIRPSPFTRRGAPVGESHWHAVAQPVSHVARGLLRVQAVPTIGSTIDSGELLESVLDSHKDQIMILDWMAGWCRKCIYLKPKVAKLMLEPDFENRVPFFFVDVNTIPGPLAQRFKIECMPTLQLVKNGEVIASMTGGEDGATTVAKLRDMLLKHL